ncbi:MAG: hypothetical protein ACREE4_08455 [Stellaceae bacterium]
MRTGIIILAALAAAVAVDAAWVWSALSTLPSRDLAVLVLHHLPALVLIGLAVYALVALVLVAGTIGFDALRVRGRLARLAVPNQQDWLAAFAATALEPLAARILDLGPLDRDWGRAGIVLQSRFDTAQARREITQLYSAALVRTQFGTALALALVLAALGVVHAGAALAVAPAGIPAVPAIAAIVVLGLFGLFGRMIVEAAAEPLFETISGLPAERLDIELLRRLAWLWEEGDAARTGGSEAALTSAIGKLLARLIDALDEGRISLVDTMTGLSAQAEALAGAMQSAIDRGAERGMGRDPAPDLAEIHSAVARLRVVMEGLAAAAQQVPAGAAAGASGAEIGAARSELSREVRSLLADLE